MEYVAVTVLVLVGVGGVALAQYTRGRREKSRAKQEALAEAAPVSVPTEILPEEVASKVFGAK